ncbi:DUF5009 domain-containing protein [Aestuariibacter sp. AA17]|uniref:DUF5009 domain-containing protein n=1 Tax=Fluctibacter corallii TaxID=2984329 RepID=A0ABT3A6H1_9ALTE|nr:DUF5009 domain-containing protein [Aestuariibacter sp. AA17]MCV2883882.1 DUF5009 domain-containing protein [Aestuariibacter sp. AA17]
MDEKSAVGKEHNVSKRWVFLDALRGFDMVWILGADKLFFGVFLTTNWTIFHALDRQMTHSEWHGVTAYDLIFPLFIFLSGVTIGLVSRQLAGDKRKNTSAILTATRRLALLVILGIMYNHGWGSGIPTNPSDIRYASVLARIGITWYVTACLFWVLPIRAIVVFAMCLLAINGWFHLFLPVPDLGSPSVTPLHSWNRWLDMQVLPGVAYQGKTPDPEGVMSTFPAIATCIAGLWLGTRIRCWQRQPDHRQITYIVVMNLGLIVAAYVLHPYYPMNKTLWTSTFGILSIGVSTLITLLFYWIIEVKGSRRIGVVFAVIGCNALFIYLATSLVSWQYLIDSLFGHALQLVPKQHQLLISVILLVSVQWLVLHAMFKRCWLVNV